LGAFKFHRPRSIMRVEQRKNKFNTLAAEEASTTQVDARSMHGYDFNVPATPPTIPPAIAKIFTIPASCVTALYTATLAQIKSTHGPKTFISIANTICGLFWLHITRVCLRAKRIQPDDTTTFATAVNICRDMTDVIAPGPGYVGNTFLRGLVSSEVGDLVQYSSPARSTTSELEEALASPATTAQISSAAFLVRDAVKTIACNRNDMRRKNLAIATRAMDPNPERN
jgi:hypothetical protein